MTRRIRYELGRGWGQLPGALPALAFGIAWTVAVVAHERGSFTSIPILLLLGVPLVLGFVMLLAGRWPPAGRLVLAWMGILAAALYTNLWITNLYVILGIPGLLVSAFLARRYPATFLVAALASTCFYGTTEAFLHFSTAVPADALLGGLWLGTIWSYLLDDKRRRTAPMTGMTLLSLYTLLSFFEIFLSPYGTTVGAQDFRGSTWYMMSFMLLAVAPLTRRTIQRAAIGFLGIAFVVGAYATFRWIFGQSHQEIQNALSQTTNNDVNGQLRLFGSFVAGKELAAWTSAAIPFCLACGLALRGRVRILALAGCALCAIGMFGADVRVALVGVVPAVLIVFALFQFSRAFSGVHLGTTLGALAAVAVIGVGAFAVTLGGQSTTAQRYKILLSHPTQDASYQARVFKWRDALADISKHPLGQGLGTSGRTQQRYGTFLNISNQDVDNSYLKIALEQGAAVALFYVVGYVLLAIGIGRRALRVRSPLDAALAIAAVAILVDFAILMFAGTYIEGLPALGIWLFVALGVAGVTRRSEQPDSVLEPAAESPPLPPRWPPHASAAPAFPGVTLADRIDRGAV